LTKPILIGSPVAREPALVAVVSPTLELDSAVVLPSSEQAAVTPSAATIAIPTIRV
jgi:hypothetical protein